MNNKTTHSAGTEARAFHFGFAPHVSQGAELHLVAHGQRLALATHDVVSRSEHRSANATLAALPDQQLTHFVTDVQVPATTSTLWFVTRKSAGAHTVVAGGVHLPAAHRAAAAATAAIGQRSFLSGKLSTLAAISGAAPSGAPASSPDPSACATADDVVDLIVFCHPELGTRDPTLMAEVLACIDRQSAAYRSLIATISKVFANQADPDPAHGFPGWAVAIPLVGLDGTPALSPNGTPLTRYTYLGSDASWKYISGLTTTLTGPNPFRQEGLSVYDCAGPVIQATLLAVRNNAALEGPAGLYVHQPAVPRQPAMASSPAAARFAAAPKADSPTDALTLTKNDWEDGRQVVVTKTSANGFEFQVNNKYFRRLGVFVRFQDVLGQYISIDDAKKANGGVDEILGSFGFTNSFFCGLADPRGTFMAVPTEGYSTSDTYSVTLPTSAHLAEVNVGGLGFQASSHFGSPTDDEHIELPALVLTVVVDLAIPLVLLVVGTTEDIYDQVKKVVTNAVTKFLREILISGLLSFLNEITKAAVDQAGGKDGSSDIGAKQLFSSDFAAGVFGAVVSAAPDVLKVLAPVIAEGATKESVENAVPVIGWIIEGIEILDSLAAIGEVLVSAGVSQPRTYNTVVASQTISLTIKPGVGGWPIDGPTTSAYRVLVQYDTGTAPMVLSNGTLDPSDNTPVQVSFENQPVGGRVSISVVFSDGASGWVAGAGTLDPPAGSNGWTDNHPNSGNTLALSVTVQRNPFPIDSGTTYVHHAMLVQTGAGLSWQTSAQAPGPAAFDTSSVTGISVDVDAEALACGWRSQSTYTSATIGLINPPYQIQARSGTLSPMLAACANDGSGTTWIAAQTDPSGPYFVFQGATGASGTLDLSATAPVYGRLLGSSLSRMVVHPASRKLFALDIRNSAIQVLPIPAAPVIDRTAVVCASGFAGPGTAVGLLDSPVAIAVVPDGTAILVLEQNLTPGGDARIQAFTLGGEPALVFADGTTSVLGIPNDPDRVYLDLQMELTGFFYVLSVTAGLGGQTPAATDFRLTIYGADGSVITAANTGMAALRFAIDRFRSVYTLNQAPLGGADPQQPSVSLWVAPPLPV
jgi:hypothetical protein